MLRDIGTNLISDLIFSFLVFIFFYAIFLLTKRRKLLKFFGIEKSKKLTIFTSNLIVEKYGSSGKDRVRYSFQGTAIPNEESKAATQLQNLFNYFLPSQVEKPGFLSKLLISDVDVKVFPSPLEDNMVEQNTTIISLGFPPYNSISRYIETSLNPSAKLDYIPAVTDLNIQKPEIKSLDKMRVIPSGNAAGTAIPAGIELDSSNVVPSGIMGGAVTAEYTGVTSGSTAPQSDDSDENPIQSVIRIPNVSHLSDPSVGFVEKIIDSQNKRFFFYVAGLSENSTAGSAYFLVDNWKLLFDKFGNNTPFLVLLRIDNHNNRRAEIIFEK